MALDAATLALTAAELKTALAEARIDKIHQPARDEVLLLMRSRTASFKLLLSARSGSARVCLTQEAYENPPVPPSFCMLLRKHLQGGRLFNVRALKGERIVFFDFLCPDELGELQPKTLAAELMGRYTNLVLVRGFAPEAPPEDAAAYKIIDAMKRVDFEDSEIRQLLPGLPYTLPPRPDRLDLLSAPRADFEARVGSFDGPVGEAVRRAAGDVGPVVAREVVWRAFAGEEPVANRMSTDEADALWRAVEAVRADAAAGGCPTLVRKADGAPTEFSFTALTQYAPACTLESYEGFSVMLEAYYAQKDRSDRLRQRARALRKTVQNLYDRAVRKQAARTEDLAESEKSEHLRVMGELLTANLHAIEKGAREVRLANWYDEGCEVLVKLDARLSPSANAQKYFKEYKKKQTAADMLAGLLLKGEREIDYLQTVLYEVDAAEGEAALDEIRAELKSQGYLKHFKPREKRQNAAKPLHFSSGEGFDIYVGRNNAQNEKLSLKTARGKDLWFHVKNAPGSHVVVMSEGRDIPLQTQNEAAMLAVWHSSQRQGAKVPVDYTEVKNLRKTSDLPPGMVLYEHYETAWVTPDEAVIKALEGQGGE